MGIRGTQRKIPVVLYPVHRNPRFHGPKSILLLFIHEMPCFRGQERHKAGGASPLAQLALRSWLAIASCGALGDNIPVQRQNTSGVDSAIHYRGVAKNDNFHHKSATPQAQIKDFVTEVYILLSIRTTKTNHNTYVNVLRSPLSKLAQLALSSWLAIAKHDDEE